MNRHTILASLLAVAMLVAAALAANEGSVSMSLKATKGSLSVTRAQSANFTINAAKPAYAGGAQAIPTGGVAIALGDISTNGVAWFQNIDATNFVEIGVVYDSTNFLPLVRLNPGEAWPFRLSQGVTPWGRANGAAVLLDKTVLDN
jgi:hypothetical protein